MLTLSQLKKHLQQNKTVTLQGLMITFREDHETIEMLLEHFIRKGQLFEQDSCYSGCGTQCGSCHLSASKTYQWKN